MNVKSPHSVDRESGGLPNSPDDLVNSIRSIERRLSGLEARIERSADVLPGSTRGASRLDGIPARGGRSPPRSRRVGGPDVATVRRLGRRVDCGLVAPGDRPVPDRRLATQDQPRSGQQFQPDVSGGRILLRGVECRWGRLCAGPPGPRPGRRPAPGVPVKAPVRRFRSEVRRAGPLQQRHDLRQRGVADDEDRRVVGAQPGVVEAGEVGRRQ